MRKAAHAGIVCLAFLAGQVGVASYSFGCSYAKQPFGSSCSELEKLVAFVQFGVPAAIVLYAVWGILLCLYRMMSAVFR
jgi:hypothetical protein